MVKMNLPESSCNNALESLLSQVNAARGVQIVKGVVPFNALLRHECGLVVNGLPARDVLASILNQAGSTMGVDDAGSKTLYSWALLYDSNTNQFFLSTMVVPKPNRTSVSSAATASPTIPTSPSSGQSRIEVPIKKQ
jgi:hypothetical protein